MHYYDGNDDNRIRIAVCSDCIFVIVTLTHQQSNDRILTGSILVAHVLSLSFPKQSCWCRLEIINQVSYSPYVVRCPPIVPVRFLRSDYPNLGRMPPQADDIRVFEEKLSSKLFNMIDRTNLMLHPSRYPALYRSLGLALTMSLLFSIACRLIRG
jgi:hypothetical protein